MSNYHFPLFLFDELRTVIRTFLALLFLQNNPFSDFPISFNHQLTHGCVCLLASLLNNAFHFCKKGIVYRNFFMLLFVFINQKDY